MELSTARALCRFYYGLIGQFAPGIFITSLTIGTIMLIAFLASKVDDKAAEKFNSIFIP